MNPFAFLPRIIDQSAHARSRARRWLGNLFTSLNVVATVGAPTPVKQRHRSRIIGTGDAGVVAG